jgi:hypothetical protein
MEEFNYPPELIRKLLENREKKNESAKQRMRVLRAAHPEKYRTRNREYMQQTGAALAYYYENKEAILARKREQYAEKREAVLALKREQYRLKKLKQKEEEGQNPPTEVI